jgi:hypothetical protein
VQYFRFSLTSKNLFTMLQQRRKNIMGFEITVELTSPSEIPGAAL